MLLEFRVYNYKTFAPEEYDFNSVLDLQVGKSRSKTDHVLKSGILKNTVIFGANSVGKSNILKAMAMLKKIVLNHDHRLLRYDAICSNIEPENIGKPIRFEVVVELPIYGDIYNLGPFSKYEYAKSNRQIFRYSMELNSINNDRIVGGDVIANIATESLDVYTSRGFVNVIDYQGTTVSDQLLDVENSLSNVEKEINDYQSQRENLEVQKSEYVKLRENLEFLSQKLDDFSKSEEDTSLNNLINSRIKQEFDSIQKTISTYDESAYDKKIEDLTAKINDCLNKKSELLRERSSLNHGLKYRARLMRSMLFNRYLTREYRSFINPGFSDDVVKNYVKTMYHWFESELCIIGADNSILENVSHHLIPELSNVVNQFDVGISKLDWKYVDDENERKLIFSSLGSDDEYRIDELMSSSVENAEHSVIISKRMGVFLFSTFQGLVDVYKLYTVHSDGTSHNLSEESDGTRRVIDLAATLLKTKGETTYVIDELDRRLHPILSKKYVSMFNSMKSMDNKQLIFTTHQVRLMTTDLFRRDEIKLIERNSLGYSEIKSLDEVDVRVTKRLEEMYLDDGAFGGLPNLK